MKIVHYFLGFPPYRSGGMTRFAFDLMTSQLKDSNEVIALWPGKMNFFRKTVSIKERKRVNGIKNYEIINPLPVPLDEGIEKPSLFMKKCDKKAFIEFFTKEKPNVIHIHTLMGLYKEMIEVANELNIKTVVTTHDYFGLCPKVTFYSDGNCDGNGCERCVKCNKTALSMTKIKLLQSPLYRMFKETNIIKSIRRKHRANFFNNKDINQKNNTSTAHDYQELRKYYISILNKVDLVHYNSTVSKEIYEKYITPKKGVVLSISHKNIKKHSTKQKTTNNSKINLIYLAPIKEFKGFKLIYEVLKELWESGNKKFILSVFGNENFDCQYIKTLGESYKNEELGKIFEDIDILIAPSIWNETFGFTVLEALSYGIPVIVSSTVGAKDIIGKAGIVFKSGDFEDLKGILERLNEKDINKYKEYAKEIKVKNWDEYKRKL